MKTTRIAVAGLIIALSLPLLVTGCTGHKDMKAMDTGMETMHKDSMDPMDKGMEKNMGKEMPMEEKKDM